MSPDCPSFRRGKDVLSALFTCDETSVCVDIYWSSRGVPACQELQEKEVRLRQRDVTSLLKQLCNRDERLFCSQDFI